MFYPFNFYFETKSQLDHAFVLKEKNVKILNFVYQKKSWLETLCSCDNEIKYPNQTSIECTYPCSGCPSESCGDWSGQYWSVYQSIFSFFGPIIT